jgi:dihydroneopterin triphosphate diphosphatase
MTSFITPHCISAYVVYQNSEGPLYLLIRRCGKYLPGTWQMISGGIESGETASQAALREIQEETGVVPQALYSADVVETFYMQSNDKITFVPVFVAFADNLKVSLSPKEHDAYEWLSFDNARERLVWAEQRRVISHIHDTCVMRRPNELLRVEINGK